MAGYPWILLMAAVLVYGYVLDRLARLNPSGVDVVEAQFRSMRIKSDDPRGQFDGCLATIVCDERMLGRYGFGTRVICLHRICKNAYGRYFLFIFTADAPPYLSQLSIERAKNALRSSNEAFEKEFGRHGEA